MYLIYDTETTGLFNYRLPMTHPSQPRCAQLGAILADADFNTVAELNVIIRPDGWTIPKEASDIHGITTEKAIKYGIPIVHALSSFNQLANLAEFIVAHNIPYDDGIMEGEFNRLQKTTTFFDKRRICTMKKSRVPANIQGARGIKMPKLIEAHQALLGVGFEGAHDAMEDVRACKRVLTYLAKANLLALEKDE